MRYEMIKAVFSIILLWNILITFNYASIMYRIKILNERIDEKEWGNLKNSFEIQFRIPSQIEPIRLSTINHFQIFYDFDENATLISFKANRNFLSQFPVSFFEVVLIDKYGEYSDSDRKRFNLLSDAIIEFSIRRIAHHTKIRILNTNVQNPIIEYDNKKLSPKDAIISGTSSSTSIRRLKITCKEYVPWDQFLFEGKLIQEKELFILLIPRVIYKRYEKAVYLFQLGYLKEAEAEFLKLRIDFPQWGYPYFYPVQIHYLENHKLNNQDIIDIKQAYEFAAYENNYLLMAEIKYLLARHNLHERKFHLAFQEAELAKNFIGKEMELFKEGRFSFYFVNADLIQKVELLSVEAEIYDFYHNPFYGDIESKKNELLSKLFNISEKVKKIVWTDDGGHYVNIYSKEITKLRTLIKSKK